MPRYVYGGAAGATVTGSNVIAAVPVIEFMLMTPNQYFCGPAYKRPSWLLEAPTYDHGR